MNLADVFLGRRQQPKQNEVLTEYLNSLPTQSYTQNLLKTYTPQQIQQGVENGLNFGVPEIATWQSQYNKGAGRNNPITAPSDPTALLDSIKSSQFNLGISNIPRQGGIIQDLMSGYKENVSTPFDVGNLEKSDKNFATRVGEFLGTARRIADAPVARAAITAGLVGATGGDVGDMLSYGLQSGAIRQQFQTQDKFYRQQLNNMGIDTSNIGGNITEDIYKNIISSRRLQQMTYGEFAMFNDKVAKMLQENPLLANQVVPTAVVNNLLSKKPEQAEANIEKIKAQTEDIRNPKPRININKREGGTTSTVNIIHSGGQGTKNDKKNIAIQGDTVLMKAPNGKIYNVPRANVEEMSKKGGVIING